MAAELPPTRWPGPPTAYLPIAEHGIIGDLHTAAMVGSDATIDWFCPQRFDGPSVFAALLDREHGGFYRIAPADSLARTKQLYLPDTNVLVTRFLSPHGVSEIQDFMPVGGGPQRLIRSAVGVRGALRFRLQVEPRFGYGLTEPEVTIEPTGAVFRAQGEALALASPLALEATSAGATAEFELAAGERLTFVLQTGDRAALLGEREASRLMCWVAIDRAMRIAMNRGLPADLARWTRVRDDIFAWIMARGWSERRQAFVQAEDSDVLDASLLLMPLVHFIAPTDPRWLSTLRAICNELVSDSLVYRYHPAAAPDGLDGDEGTFSMCSFWYVECLARAGYVEDAALAFEKMLTYANHLGLYSEQIGLSGELLGNFPQAFTHLALICAAIRLDRELQTERRSQAKPRAT